MTSYPNSDCPRGVSTTAERRPARWLCVVVVFCTLALPQATWAVDMLQQLKHDEVNGFPLLKARLELAIEFGLSRAEALLIDVPRADCGHCLVIDIRAIHPRSRRRLVMLETNEQRHLLNRIVQMFDGTDPSMHGPEGNYRQRLYRLRMLVRPGAPE